MMTVAILATNCMANCDSPATIIISFTSDTLDIKSQINISVFHNYLSWLNYIRFYNFFE